MSKSLQELDPCLEYVSEASIAKLNLLLSLPYKRFFESLKDVDITGVDTRLEETDDA